MPEYRRLVYLFADHPGEDSLFSIHNMCQVKHGVIGSMSVVDQTSSYRTALNTFLGGGYQSHVEAIHGVFLRRLSVVVSVHG